ncbi:MAG: DMP19 family protein [Prevotella sp.]|nr:DMP19 family protein [Prevotella sp.]
MKQITVKDQDLSNAAMEGMDAFIHVFVEAIHEAIGGELTDDTMQELNADQLTLLAWDTLHEEVMDGGFIQLIHNGYGPYIFKNPFAKALNKLWGMRELSKILYEVHTLWLQNREEIERDCTDEEFMALFERFPQFDDYDDMFVENEEEYTSQVAHYIDEHIEKFATIV